MCLLEKGRGVAMTLNRLSGQGLLCLIKKKYIKKWLAFRNINDTFSDFRAMCVFLERTFVCCCYILRMYNWLAWICIGHE